MEVNEVDLLAEKIAKIYDEMDPLAEKLKALQSEVSEMESQLSIALVEHNKDVWNIPGRKPFKLSVKTYWNVTDVNKFFSSVKPDMLSTGYLGQAIRAWANAEVKDGRDPEQGLGIKHYDKISITGGQRKER